MSFMMLPPEINSLRMYTGPGAGPLLAAASSWEAIAAQLGITAAGFGRVVDGLTAEWLGPSSVAMTSTATVLQGWLMTTADQAMQTATQVMAAVGAYEAAFAATVPPAEVAANRSLLAALVATNFLGINTPAIMAAEAQYVEMWAQDVSAMVGYLQASLPPIQLQPFSPPNATLSPHPVTPVAVGLGESIFSPNSGNSTTGLPGLLNMLSGASNSAFGNMLNSNLVNSISNFEGNVLGAFGGTGLANPGTTIAPFAAMAEAAQQAAPSPGSPPSSVDPGSAGAGPTAEIGTAPSVGNLSVPQSWGNSAPGAFTEIDRPIPLDDTPFVGIPGVPLVAGIQQGKAERTPYGKRQKVIPRHPSAG